MPISDAEFEDRSVSPDGPAVEPVPVEEQGDPMATVRAFFEANAAVAFTRAEVVRGVSCRPSLPPGRLGEILTSLPNQLADLRADFLDGDIAVDDYSDAVDRLREEGEIVCARIDRGDGEPVVYYRLA
jgi:hypothetical protein